MAMKKLFLTLLVLAVFVNPVWAGCKVGSYRITENSCNGLERFRIERCYSYAPPGYDCSSFGGDCVRIYSYGYETPDKTTYKRVTYWGQLFSDYDKNISTSNRPICRWSMNGDGHFLSYSAAKRCLNEIRSESKPKRCTEWRVR